MDERKRAALQVMERLEQAGFAAYLVGGCVRDELLGRQPQDYDVATEAHPYKVQEIFPRTVPTGLQHGTVTVVQQGIPVEVTTFRVEEGYEDRRRPSQVAFVSSLKLDLARRDFTVNAMARDRHGKLIDYFSGVQDLEAQVIRTVGEPLERFREDALRMLRAARFVAQFGFSLDDKAKRAIEQLKQESRFLSVERVVSELEKMWRMPTPSPGMGILFETGLIAALPPFYQWIDESKPAADRLERFDWVQDRIVRWSYLLSLCGTGEAVLESRLTQLKLANRDKEAIIDCLKLGSKWERQGEEEWKRLLYRFGILALKRAAQLAELLGRRQVDDPDEAKLEEWWQAMPVKQTQDLPITGTELIRHVGKKAGPWVGKTLAYLAEQAALQHIPNEREALLKEGCQIGAKYSQ
ncbi:CCA tRNA nucleotidyltransferase [Laceyella putida]|uniref:CCA tRNA nucleotidyltransferase n=1 Tax=Laceyella putida TaxID=110101 RepID=A0ABW2RM47_9BACL